ncbi:hypothetical protein GCM10027596_30380 [Nocardioides korecus]
MLAGRTPNLRASADTVTAANPSASASSAPAVTSRSTVNPARTCLPSVVWCLQPIGDAVQSIAGAPSSAGARSPVGSPVGLAGPKARRRNPVITTNDQVSGHLDPVVLSVVAARMDP